MSRHEIFPMTAPAVLGALEGKTAEDMAQSLLKEEEEMEEEKIFEAIRKKYGYTSEGDELVDWLIDHIKN